MPVAATAARHIPLEGAFNFRDLGGYAGAGGRPVRWKMLYRSDGLQRLTATDISAVTSLGLRSVLDLRTEFELTERGRLELPEVVLAFHHLSLLPALPTAEEFKSWSGPAQIAAHYLEMVDLAQDKIRAALVVLSSSDSYPALFHCATGKDRTGVLGSVVLGLLGVSEEDIVADYMLTAQATERMIKRIHDDHPERVKEMDGATPAILLTTPDTMEIFLGLFFERYGSFDGYADAIGFEGGAKALQDVLLEV